MADIVTSRIFQDGEKNITAVKMNDIIGSSVIQPAFVSSKPSTSTIASTDNLLVLQTAGTYVKAPFQTVIDSVNAGLNTDTEIWNVRLRSFNAIGNPTFEVNQRSPGTVLSLAAGNTSGFPLDRWMFLKNAATAVINSNQQVSNNKVAGTNFLISQNQLVITLVTAQATLAATEFIELQQNIEGPLLRELLGDVHSISLMAYCSQPITFTVGLFTNSTPYYSLTNLCQISTPNQWTLFQLPNLPVWTPNATWTLTPGNQGYAFRIGLGAGSTFTSPANGTWQSGNFVCGPGTTNFASLPVNSSFYLCFLQHEPGPVCSTPMDCPFTQNYDACLRYYCKSYNYAVKPGTVDTSGAIMGTVPAGSYPYIYTPYKKVMAKDPGSGLIPYSGTTGAASSVRDVTANADRAATSVIYSGQGGFGGFGTSTQNAGVATYSWHYTADTGW